MYIEIKKYLTAVTLLNRKRTTEYLINLQIVSEFGKEIVLLVVL